MRITVLFFTVVIFTWLILLNLLAKSFQNLSNFAHISLNLERRQPSPWTILTLKLGNSGKYNLKKEYIGKQGWLLAQTGSVSYPCNIEWPWVAVVAQRGHLSRCHGGLGFVDFIFSWGQKCVTTILFQGPPMMQLLHSVDCPSHTTWTNILYIFCCIVKVWFVISSVLLSKMFTLNTIKTWLENR